MRRARSLALLLALVLLPRSVAASDAAGTDDAARGSAGRVALGERLFGDRALSATGTVACATCHDPARAFADGRAVARGVNGFTGARNTPSLLDVADRPALFWDGRSSSLEDQATRPFVHALEMGLADHDQLLRILRADASYLAAFELAFGPGEPDAVSVERAALALATYQRTLRSGVSAFDRSWFGGEADALDAAAERGLELFAGRAGCVACHPFDAEAAPFTDAAYHDVGVATVDATTSQIARRRRAERADRNGFEHEVIADARWSALGRFLVTGRDRDLGAFRTPSLRNVAVTGPYLHDGSQRSLRAVVEHFLARVGTSTFTAQEVDDLVAFLRALTSEEWLPLLPPTDETKDR